MPSSTSLRAALLACVVCLALPLSTEAQDARELFQRGQAAYDQGDYEEAIERWTSAYEADPRPRIQFNLAQAYERLGRLPDALAALEDFVENADTNDPYMADARARLGTMRERIDRTGILLVGAPDGARIAIDEQSWGVTPRPDAIQVDPGSHRVTLEREGYQPFVAVVSVPVGEELTLEVAMTRDAGSTGSDSSSVGTSLGGDQGGINPVPWILIGGGGALAITAVALGVVALGQAGDAVTTQDEDSATTLALTADILGAVGAAAGAAGVVLLVLELTGEESDSGAASVEWAPRVTADGQLGVDLLGRF